MDYWTTIKLIRTRLLALQEEVEIQITQTTVITTTTTLLESRGPDERLQGEEDDYRVPLAPSDALEPTLTSVDMSLIGAVGGRSLAVEMRVALEESRKLLIQLEEALKCPTPQGAEVDKMYYSFVSTDTDPQVLNLPSYTFLIPLFFFFFFIN